MQALALRTIRPATAARFVVARPRSAAVAPVRRLSSAAIRAQAEDESKKDVPAAAAAAAAPAGSSSAVTPRGTWEMMPSWSRMNQVRGLGLRSCSSRLGRRCRCPWLLLARRRRRPRKFWRLLERLARLTYALAACYSPPVCLCCWWRPGSGCACWQQRVLQCSRCCFRRPLSLGTSHHRAVVRAPALVIEHPLFPALFLCR